MGATPSLLESLTETVTQDVDYSNAPPWLSLHSADPGSTGLHEITSGSGVSGRQIVDFAGSGGVDNSTAVVQVEVAAGHTVTWIGFWDAQTGGTFLGGFPFVAYNAAATCISGAASITCPGNTLTTNAPVRLFSIPGVWSTGMPVGFTEDTVYFVKSTAAGVITLSATIGGVAIVPGSTAAFLVCPDLSYDFVVDGLLEFPMGGVTWETTS